MIPVRRCGVGRRALVLAFLGGARTSSKDQDLTGATMSKKPETPMERLKKVAMWQWGLIVIFAGVASNLLMGLQASTGGSAAARGQALGRGAATMLFVIAGVVLIIMHFVRRKRR